MKEAYLQEHLEYFLFPLDFSEHFYLSKLFFFVCVFFLFLLLSYSVTSHGTTQLIDSPTGKPPYKIIKFFQIRELSAVFHYCVFFLFFCSFLQRSEVLEHICNQDDTWSSPLCQLFILQSASMLENKVPSQDAKNPPTTTTCHLF